MRGFPAILWPLLLGFSACVVANAPAPRAADAASPDADVDVDRELSCAGEERQDSRVVEAFGLTADGQPVTVGVALACEPHRLVALDWGIDSSGRWEIPEADAMRVWRAFEAAPTLEERRMILLRTL